mmetsp:Transcript_71384/g.159826  ORF Transcript_71384/g.159826 Transcript_71384/m.159826 type:complete len:288 (+) Transcript_71384:232-1095(+)
MPRVLAREGDHRRRYHQPREGERAELQHVLLLVLRFRLVGKLHALVDAEHAGARSSDQVGPRSRAPHHSEGAEQAVHSESARQGRDKVGRHESASHLQEDLALLAAGRYAWPSYVDPVHQREQDHGGHGVAQEVQELRQEKQHTQAHAVPRVDHQMGGEQPHASPEEGSPGKEYRADIVVGLSLVQGPHRDGEEGGEHQGKRGQPQIALDEAEVRASEVLLEGAAWVGELHDVLCVDRLTTSRNHRGNVLPIHRGLNVERQVVCDDLLGPLAERLDDLRPPDKLFAR